MTVIWFSCERGGRDGGGERAGGEEWVFEDLSEGWSVVGLGCEDDGD